MNTIPKIKVCGITQRENMMEIAALHPDFMGFIFHGPSKRDVSQHIDNLPLANIPRSVQKVAVMVNKPLEEAREIIKKHGFDLVQLHGSESPGYCRQLQNTVPVIKAFAIGQSLPENIKDYEDACDYFLFDAMGKEAGGNGIAFDHTLLKELDVNNPWFLAGGISPEFEFRESAETTEEWQLSGNLFALDINSRFEISPGIKDVDRVKDFLLALRNQQWQNRK